MPQQAADTTWQRSVILLSHVVLATVIIGSLYWMQMIFIPVVLAILLTFVLNPFVKRLQKNGLPRVPAVCIVILLTGTFLGGISWLLTRQVTALLQDLPNYEANIKTKVESIKNMGSGTGRFEKMIHDIISQWKGEVPLSEDGEPAPSAAANNQKTVTIDSGPSWFANLPQYLSTALQSLGGLVFVLCSAFSC